MASMASRPRFGWTRLRVCPRLRIRESSSFCDRPAGKSRPHAERDGGATVRWPPASRPPSPEGKDLHEVIEQGGLGQVLTDQDLDRLLHLLEREHFRHQ